MKWQGKYNFNSSFAFLSLIVSSCVFLVSFFTPVVTSKDARVKNGLMSDEELNILADKVSLRLLDKLSEQVESVLRNRLKEENKSSDVRSKEEIDGKIIQVIATAYTADCKGCSGITYTGLNVRDHNPNIIAVDPNVIPLGSICEVWIDGELFGVFAAEDTGGKIKGKRIDILMDTIEQAKEFGVKEAEVKIIGKRR